MVDSCLECKWCKEGEENYCDNGMTGTYNGVRKHGRVGGNQDLTKIKRLKNSSFSHIKMLKQCYFYAKVYSKTVERFCCCRLGLNLDFS